MPAAAATAPAGVVRMPSGVFNSEVGGFTVFVT
jgi:hypothetical protein